MALESQLYVTYQETPLGWLKISGCQDFISEVSFLAEAPENPAIPAQLPQPLISASKQLSEYFAGNRTSFNLPLKPIGTDFQQIVWEQLKQIPFGKTHSYLQVALNLGEKTFTRAVGNANGRNPLAIVVPCHRVIGANGTLTGYAGGLWRKKWLLQFESAHKQTELFPD